MLIIASMRAFGVVRMQLVALMEANRERLPQPSTIAASDFRFVEHQHHPPSQSSADDSIRLMSLLKISEQLLG